MDALTCLLENGADPNIQDEEGETPLHTAYFSDCFHDNGISCILLEKGENATIPRNQLF